MADEQDRPALAGDTFPSSRDTFSETPLADGKDLVDDQDLRLEVGGDSKS